MENIYSDVQDTCDEKKINQLFSKTLLLSTTYSIQGQEENVGKM